MRGWPGWVRLVMLAAGVLSCAIPGAALGQTPQASQPASQPATQPATSAQNFAAVLQDPGHREEVLTEAEATPAWVALACGSANFAPAPEVAVYAPLKFDAAGTPVAGEWREAVLATGCGQTMQLNVLTEVSAPATLSSGALEPGATIADPVLQNMAQAFAVRAAGGLPAGCKNAFVENTAFLGFQGLTKAPPNGEITAPWQEDWVLDLCGGLKVVKLQFSPGVQGISLGVVDVK